MASDKQQIQNGQEVEEENRESGKASKPVRIQSKSATTASS